MENHVVKLAPSILVADLPLETRLMISDPDRFLDEFAEAGSRSFLVHCEGKNNLHRTVQHIKALGKGAEWQLTQLLPRRLWKKYSRMSTRCWT